MFTDYGFEVGEPSRNNSMIEILSFFFHSSFIIWNVLSTNMLGSWFSYRYIAIRTIQSAGVKWFATVLLVNTDQRRNTNPSLSYHGSYRDTNSTSQDRLPSSRMGWCVFFLSGYLRNGCHYCCFFQTASYLERTLSKVVYYKGFSMEHLFQNMSVDIT